MRTAIKKIGYSNNKGFTLIELLIVIAVLGTLAVVVLIALNPVQQLARTRDSGRNSTVAQLGHAMEARGTTNGGQYPDAAGGDCGGGTLSSWISDCLVTAGEINNTPDSPPYSSGTGADCLSGEGGICYDQDTGTSFVVYMQAEADSNTSQCPTVAEAYFVYASEAGRGGLYCTGGGVPTAAGFNVANFVQ